MKIMQERVQKHEKIEVLFEHNVVGLFGDNGVERYYECCVALSRRTKRRYGRRFARRFSSWLSVQAGWMIFKSIYDTDRNGIPINYRW